MMKRILLILCCSALIYACRDTNGENPPSQEDLQKKASAILSPEVEETEVSQKVDSIIDPTELDTIKTGE